MKRFLIAAMAVLALGVGTTRADPSEEPDAAQQKGDDASERELLRPLAAHGHPVAQFNLGVIYDVGRGVAQDHVRAYMWFALGAGAGYAGAAKNRNSIAREMTPERIAQAQQLALDCQKRNFRACD